MSLSCYLEPLLVSLCRVEDVECGVRIPPKDLHVACFLLALPCFLMPTPFVVVFSSLEVAIASMFVALTKVMLILASLRDKLSRDEFHCFTTTCSHYFTTLKHSPTSSLPPNPKLSHFNVGSTTMEYVIP
jgi:hypothetical protein